MKLTFRRIYCIVFVLQTKNAHKYDDIRIPLKKISKEDGYIKSPEAMSDHKICVFQLESGYDGYCLKMLMYVSLNYFKSSVKYSHIHYSKPSHIQSEILKKKEEAAKIKMKIVRLKK